MTYKPAAWPIRSILSLFAIIHPCCGKSRVILRQGRGRGEPRGRADVLGENFEIGHAFGKRRTHRFQHEARRPQIFGQMREPIADLLRRADQRLGDQAIDIEPVRPIRLQSGGRSAHALGKGREPSPRFANGLLARRREMIKADQNQIGI